MSSLVGLFLPNDPTFGNGDVGKIKDSSSLEFHACQQPWMTNFEFLWSRTPPSMRGGGRGGWQGRLGDSIALQTSRQGCCWVNVIVFTPRRNF